MPRNRLILGDWMAEKIFYNKNLDLIGLGVPFSFNGHRTIAIAIEGEDRFAWWGEDRSAENWKKIGWIKIGEL